MRSDCLPETGSFQKCFYTLLCLQQSQRHNILLSCNHLIFSVYLMFYLFTYLFLFQNARGMHWNIWGLTFWEIKFLQKFSDIFAMMNVSSFWSLVYMNVLYLKIFPLIFLQTLQEKSPSGSRLLKSWTVKLSPKAVNLKLGFCVASIQRLDPRNRQHHCP